MNSSTYKPMSLSSMAAMLLILVSFSCRATTPSTDEVVAAIETLAVETCACTSRSCLSSIAEKMKSIDLPSPDHFEEDIEVLRGPTEKLTACFKKAMRSKDLRMTP